MLIYSNRQVCLFSVSARIAFFQVGDRCDSIVAVTSSSLKGLKCITVMDETFETYREPFLERLQLLLRFIP